MNSIEISVKPRYIAGKSDVYRDRYAFNYQITICNRSNEVITLRQRFWEVTDGHGEIGQDFVAPRLAGIAVGLQDFCEGFVEV